MELQSGQKVLVMGLAKSGVGVARLLISHGIQVVVNEMRERVESDVEADALEELGARMVFGGHPLTLLEEGFSFIVKNPGIPYQVPFIQEALRRNIPIYTEIEVASWYASAPIVAITGSNGKTTTTTLVGEILQASHLNPVVAGNIGRALSGVISDVFESNKIVLEVSSFQLMGTREFHPTVAALLNFYPAHLDYHGSFEEYQEAKWKMFENQTAQDVAVLNFDQDVIRSRASSLAAQVVWFSREGIVENGVYVENDMIVVNKNGKKTDVLGLDEVALKGQHNLENVLCSVAVSLWAGATVESVRDVLKSFQGVEHRLEFVAKHGNVAFYNDSKATNSQAAVQALKAFDGSVIWIAGGLDRGDDFRSMIPEIEQRVRTAILLGQSKNALKEACEEAGLVDIHLVDGIETAVKLANEVSQPGDTVLLSPACASWDMFASFEERGRMFKDNVHRL